MNPKIETTRMSPASLQHILQPFLKLPFARLSRGRLGKQSEHLLLCVGATDVQIKKRERFALWSERSPPVEASLIPYGAVLGAEEERVDGACEVCRRRTSRV
jgi:hypothetical protein